MTEQTSQSKEKNWLRLAIAFLGGQCISMFGSSLVQFSINWYVARETGSGLMVAAMTFATFLPQIFMSLFGGVWADKYNRKHLIMIADASIAVATAILAFIMHLGYQNIWIIIFVSCIRSLGSGVQTPAVSAVLPQIVPQDKLMKVNSINSSVFSIVNLVAPAVGGAVLSMGSIQHILMIDVVTALIGLTILAFIPIAMHERTSIKDDHIAELKEGLQYARDHFFARTLFKCYAAFSILLVPAAVLNVLFVTKIYGDSYIYLTLNEMVFFLGAILGGFVLGINGGFRNRLHTLAFGSVAFGITTIIMGLKPHFHVYLFIMFITGLTMPCFNAPVMSLLQEKVEPDKMGRVFGLSYLVSSVSLLIGVSVFGYLAEITKLEYLMLFTGFLMIILTLLFMLRNKAFMKEGEPIETPPVE